MSGEPPNWTDHVALTLLLASVPAVIAWLLSSGGAWDATLSAIGLAVALVPFGRKYQRRAPPARFSSPNERAAHCERMRELLQNRIYDQRAQKLRGDVIIKDVTRQTEYPYEGHLEKGISAWFRLGLVETYHRGIVVAHHYGCLKKEADGYRFRDWVNDEEGDIKVLQVSNIPFDVIASVNLEGDEFYGYPHIVCHFDFAGEPYEETWYAEERESSPGKTYLHRVATDDEVRKNNGVDGTLSFG